MSERTRYGSSGATTGLLVFVALVVALVPLPIGSVRPIVWALWIAASALALIAFVLAGGRRISSPPRWIAVLQWLLLLTLICQMLPIGLIQPITFDLAGFDAAFDTIWRYYLMYCEGGFRSGGIDVVQTLLKRP